MPAAGFQVGAVRGREVLFAKGYEIDLADALARELAVPAVRFVQEDRFTAFFQPGPKDYDLALSQITITAAREAVVDFSAPYFTADQAVLLRRGLTLKKRRFSQLRKLRLCAERATTGGTQAKRIHPDRPVRLFRDPSRLEAELYQRRCDAVIGDSARARRPARPGAAALRRARGPDQDRRAVRDRARAGQPAARRRSTPPSAALEDDGTLGRLAAALVLHRRDPPARLPLRCRRPGSATTRGRCSRSASRRSSSPRACGSPSARSSARGRRSSTSPAARSR